MVAFGVDDVVPAAARLATRPRAERERGVLGGGAPATPLITHGGVQPLLAAVGVAFAQHRLDGARAQQPIIPLGDSLATLLHAALDAGGNVDEHGPIAPRSSSADQ